MNLFYRYACLSFIVCIALTACTAKELKPGEAEWIAVVEQAEAVVASGTTDKDSCQELRELYSSAEDAFKALLPHLEGFSIRTRDQRMGIIKEYKEKNC